MHRTSASPKTAQLIKGVATRRYLADSLVRALHSMARDVAGRTPNVGLNEVNRFLYPRQRNSDPEYLSRAEPDQRKAEHPEG